MHYLPQGAADQGSTAAPPALVIQKTAVPSGTGERGQSEVETGGAATRQPAHIAAGWKSLSKVLFKLGQWTRATQALSRLIASSPGDADAHNDLGRVFYNLGREEEAEASYRRALQFDPGFAKAYDNLGALLADRGRPAEAAENFRQSIAINPDSHFAWHCMGTLLDRFGGRDDQAIACLNRSIALNPGTVDAYNTLGNLLLRTGQPEKSLAMFRRARDLSPLTTWRARKEQADFSVLLLYAPGSGCTPINYLVRSAPFDCHFYCVLPDAPDDIDLLRAKADLVINMIADADYGKKTLPQARQLVERLGRPTLNHPEQVMGSDRETTARRLAGISLCRIPKTLRLSGPDLGRTARDQSRDGFALPLLVRVAGNHGGDDFEKISDLAAVADFVNRHPGADFYLMEYLDYQSEDGFFRKYRFISIDGELFPYHLAIHDDWKVHHFRTRMAEHAWMREEEAVFLSDPHQLFDEPKLAALRAVAAGSGLDYCGIDCALDRYGQVVIFEANAAMLVHDEKDSAFLYKNHYIGKIRDAFQARLGRLARETP